MLREDMLEQLKTEPVVVISGGTGSGKTTQIPQYVTCDVM
jgi:ATP-dependent RNA helicase DHX36